MGWSRGSQLLEEIIVVLAEAIPDPEVKESVYNELIDMFEDFDCDTINECVGEDPIFDKVYYEKYPDENPDADEE